MASTSRPVAPPIREDIAALKTELYEACVPFTTDNPKIVFHQNDIFNLDIIPNDDVHLLLQVAQVLLDEKLFKVVHDTDGMGWKLRTLDEAKKYVLLDLKFRELEFGLTAVPTLQIPLPHTRTRNSLLTH